jgi:hypothetical protein
VQNTQSIHVEVGVVAFVGRCIHAVNNNNNMWTAGGLLVV